MLNQLFYHVCSNHPDEKELADLLKRTKSSKDIRDMIIAVFQTLAITCICGIIGGSVRDMLATSITAFAIFWIFHFLKHLRTDDIINNTIGMFTATVLAYALADIGLADHVSEVLVSESLLMIPGIPLVNAFRNLICGYELNGFVQLMRVILASASLAIGTYCGVILMGGASAW